MSASNIVKGRSFAEFNAANNPDIVYPEKIKAALESLKKQYGPEGYETDGEFRSRTKLPPMQYTAYKDQFKAHQVMVPASDARGGRRLVWVATVAAAKKFQTVAGVTGVE